MNIPYHIPVMLHETVDGMNIVPGGIYADMTFGGGGHSREILRRMDDAARLYSFDQDADAERNIVDDARFTFVRSNFRYLWNWMRYHGVEQLDGVLADLGVSSHQFDEGELGFSFRFDAKLDMRMNRNDPLSAYDVVNGWSYEELRRILYDYGEERYAPKIAAAICARREVKPVETTLELVDIIRSAMPASALREKQHPAKRSFQAIRIAVNDELGSVEKVMRDAIPCLNPGGRLAIITFHSLEDRLVKNGMAANARGCTCPPSFPVCVCGNRPKVKLISKKPIVSGSEELERNPRARSAKLRVCEKL